MTDLDQFDTVSRSDSGAECTLNDLRTGKATEAVIVLRGMDGEHFANLKAQQRAQSFLYSRFCELLMRTETPPPPITQPW